MDVIILPEVQGPLVVLVENRSMWPPLQRKNHTIGKAAYTEMKVAFIISLHRNSGLVKLYWGLVQLRTYEQHDA